jgi:hypothetical protein
VLASTYLWRCFIARQTSSDGLVDSRGYDILNECHKNTEGRYYWSSSVKDGSRYAWP